MLKVITDPIFTTSLATTMVYDFNKSQLVDHILNLEKTAPSNARSNAGGWQSLHCDQLTYDTPMMQELVNTQILPIFQSVSQSWGYPVANNVSYWYNVNRKYNYNQAHYHPQCLLSGVLYIKVPSNSGKITFMRASSEADRMDFLSQWQMDHGELPTTPNISVQHWSHPVENLLAIFPAHLEHLVGQNNTLDADDARISIAFNYFLK